MIDKKVAVVGMGGLGSHSAELLARAGIGELQIIDHDVVEISDLDRTMYTKDDVGKKKVVCAKEKLEQMSNTKVEVFAQKLDSDFVFDCDLVLDCTDNIKARYLMDDICDKWIHASCTRDLGEVMVVMPDGPRYRDVFQDKKDMNHEITNTAVAVTSAVQVSEAMKILQGRDFCRDLIRIDLANLSMKRFSL